MEHRQAIDHSRNAQVRPMILRDPVLRDPAGFALLASRDYSVESFTRGFLAEMRAL